MSQREDTADKFSCEVVYSCSFSDIRVTEQVQVLRNQLGYGVLPV